MPPKTETKQARTDYSDDDMFSPQNMVAVDESNFDSEEEGIAPYTMPKQRRRSYEDGSPIQPMFLAGSDEHELVDDYSNPYIFHPGEVDSPPDVKHHTGDHQHMATSTQRHTPVSQRNKIVLLGDFNNQFFCAANKAADKDQAIELLANGGCSIVQYLTQNLTNHKVVDLTREHWDTYSLNYGPDPANVSDRPNAIFEQTIFKDINGQLTSIDNPNLLEIQQANTIVLGLGTNDFRNFWYRLTPNGYLTTRNSRQEHILKFNEFKASFQQNCRLIIDKIRRDNKTAHIIFMTPLYPSFTPDTHEFYKIMLEIGRTLSISRNPHNPRDVIQFIMQEWYAEIFNDRYNLSVLDVTSSLEPITGNNHTQQIKPNDAGGYKIARMLGAMISKGATWCADKFIQFLPAFFDSKTEDWNSVKTTPIKVPSGRSHTQAIKWVPKHPNEFVNKATYTHDAAYNHLKDSIVQKGDHNETARDTYLHGIKKSLILDQKLSQAIIIVHQVDPTLLTSDSFEKIRSNEPLRSALLAAHNYYNSNRFGFFRTHGRHGINETKNFVRNLMQIPSDDNFKANCLAAMKKWLKTSNVHNSSRAAYAASSGFFTELFNKQHPSQYAIKTTAERREELTQMLNAPQQGPTYL